MSCRFHITEPRAFRAFAGTAVVGSLLWLFSGFVRHFRGLLAAL